MNQLPNGTIAVGAPGSLARRLAELQDAALGAVDLEPELPGRMPDAVWEVIHTGDRDTVEASMRSLVRLTKAGIRERIQNLPEASP